MVYLTGAFKTLPPTGCISPATNVEKVVCLAEDFKATLTSAQITTLQPALRIRLPQRIAITDLNMSQVLAALAVLSLIHI